MAKKQTKKGPAPTFEVRFVGEGISPEVITLRQVNDALSAVQDIASGRDPFEQSSVPPERGIGLVDVKRGSAVFSCVSRSPIEAISNLTILGKLLENIADVDISAHGDRLVSALQPIQHLSEVAKAVGCEVQVRASRRTLLALKSAAYEILSSRLLLKGETTVIGSVQRVGGATNTKCALRVEGRRKLLYCNVANKKLACRLGEKLYERIVATGTATWINRTWRLVSFTIVDFTQPKFGDTRSTLDELRSAGLDAWDHVNPEDVLREIRN